MPEMIREKWTMPRRKVFGVPLQKDLQKGADGSVLVRGFFTSDNKDEIGDVITRDATERALPKYREWGNIRYMHLPMPVGKITRIGVQDGLEWNEVEIKVIDPKAAFEVENGLLQALSVGIMVNFDDIEMLEDGGWQINDYQLAEISLVDHPANYDARLQLPDNEPTKMFAREYGIDALAKTMEALKAFNASSEAIITQIDVIETSTEEEPVEKGAVPYKNTGKADEGTAWSKPSLGDFTDKDFEELSDSEKRRIANHFGYTVNMPPETFGDCKLPHHQAAKSGIGPAVWNGVKAAMSRLMQSGTDIPDGDRKAVYNHLSKHYAEFNKEPPEFKALGGDANTEETLIENTVEAELSAEQTVEITAEATTVEGSVEAALEGEQEVPAEDAPAPEEVPSIETATEIVETISEEVPATEQPETVTEAAQTSVDSIAALMEAINSLRQEVADLRKSLEAPVEVPEAQVQAASDEVTVEAVITEPEEEEEIPGPAVNRKGAIQASETIQPTEEIPEAPKDLKAALRNYFATRNH